MPIQNRKSFSMSPGGKSAPRPSSPRPAAPKPAYRPSAGVSHGPSKSFSSSPLNENKDAGAPGSQAFRETRAGYPGYRRPFYRHPASIISLIVFILACLACLAIVAVVWVLPSLLNGSFHL